MYLIIYIVLIIDLNGKCFTLQNRNKQAWMHCHRIMLAEIYHECIKDHIACRLFIASSPVTNGMITNVDSHGVNATNWLLDACKRIKSKWIKLTRCYSKNGLCEEELKLTSPCGYSACNSWEQSDYFFSKQQTTFFYTTHVTKNNQQQIQDRSMNNMHAAARITAFLGPS